MPPLDVADRLMQSFAPDVASVAAVYRSRFQTGQLIVWDRGGKFLNANDAAGLGVQKRHPW